MRYTVNMEPSQNQSNRSTFRFRFSPLLLAVMIAGVLLCLACISLTTFQLVEFIKADPSSVYGWLKYMLMYIASVLLLVILCAVLIKTQYVITNEELILQYGIVKTKYKMKTIYSVEILEKTNKVILYFNEFKTKYSVLAVKEEWCGEFVKTLQDKNDKIEIELVGKSDEPKNDDKKK